MEIYCNGMMEKQLLVFMDNSLMMVIILMKTMIKQRQERKGDLRGGFNKSSKRTYLCRYILNMET